MEVVVRAVRDDSRGLLESFRGLCAIYYFLKRLRDMQSQTDKEQFREHWKTVRVVCVNVHLCVCVCHAHAFRVLRVIYYFLKRLSQTEHYSFCDVHE